MIVISGGPRAPLRGSKWDAAAQMRHAPTAGEARLWNRVKQGGINTYRGSAIRVNRQQVIRGFIADFYLPVFRAIVEIDGGYHEDEYQERYDGRRDDLFRDWRYSVLRISDALVLRDVDLVAEIIEAFVDWIDDEDGVALSWSIDESGRLFRRHRGRNASAHFFRIAPSLPEHVDVMYGAEVGEVDCHDLTSKCAGERCLTDDVPS